MVDTRTPNNFKKMEFIFSLAKKIKSPNIIVGYSGGKDSSYLLYLLKEKYNLEPLAFSVIHPFVNQLAIENMEKVTDKLKIQFEKFIVDEDFHKKVISHGLNNYSKYFDGKLSDLYGCKICSEIYIILTIKKAIELNIPFVCFGSEHKEHPIILGKFLINIQYKTSNIINDVFSGKYNNTMYDLDISRRDLIKEFPTIINPLSIINYSEDFIRKFLDEKDLISYYDSTYLRTNCTVRHLFSYLSFKQFNEYPYYNYLINSLHSSFTEEKDIKEFSEQYLKELKETLFFVANNPNCNIDELNNFTKDFKAFNEINKEHSINKYLLELPKHAEYFDIKI